MTTLKAALVVSLAAAALSLGCGDDTTAPSSTTNTTPTTQTISSLLYPLDQQVTWVDIVGTSGTITATLVSTTPPNAAVGLGIGLRAGTCLLTRSVNAVAGTQLAVPVEPGSYCVAVFDNGTLNGATVPYQLTVAYP